MITHWASKLCHGHFNSMSEATVMANLSQAKSANQLSLEAESILRTILDFIREQAATHSPASAMVVQLIILKTVFVQVSCFSTTDRASTTGKTHYVDIFDLDNRPTQFDRGSRRRRRYEREEDRDLITEQIQNVLGITWVGSSDSASLAMTSSVWLLDDAPAPSVDTGGIPAEFAEFPEFYRMFTRLDEMHPIEGLLLAYAILSWWDIGKDFVDITCDELNQDLWKYWSGDPRFKDFFINGKATLLQTSNFTESKLLRTARVTTDVRSYTWVLAYDHDRDSVTLQIPPIYDVSKIVKALETVLEFTEIPLDTSNKVPAKTSYTIPDSFKEFPEVYTLFTSLEEVHPLEGLLVGSILFRQPPTSDGYILIPFDVFKFDYNERWNKDPLFKELFNSRQATQFGADSLRAIFARYVPTPTQLDGADVHPLYYDGTTDNIVLQVSPDWDIEKISTALDSVFGWVPSRRDRRFISASRTNKPKK